MYPTPAFPPRECISDEHDSFMARKQGNSILYFSFQNAEGTPDAIIAEGRQLLSQNDPEPNA